MVYAQMDHRISVWLLDLDIVKNQKKRTCRIVDVTVLAVHRVKQKESEKRDKYQDFAWELNKLQNIKVTMISFEIAVIGTLTKGLVTGTRSLGNMKTSGDHPNYIIVEPEYWEESWRLYETCCPSNSTVWLTASLLKS